MTTYYQGQTVTMSFSFYRKNSTTVLEDQDSVKFYIIRHEDWTNVYEGSLTKTSTGTYSIDVTMPMNNITTNKKKYEYRVYGLKSGFQQIYTDVFYVK